MHRYVDPGGIGGIGVIKAIDFFELEEFAYKDLFENTAYVWEALGRIKAYVQGRLSPNVGPLGGQVLNKTCILWEDHDKLMARETA